MARQNIACFTLALSGSRSGTTTSLQSVSSAFTQTRAYAIAGMRMVVNTRLPYSPGGSVRLTKSEQNTFTAPNILLAVLIEAASNQTTASVQFSYRDAILILPGTPIYLNVFAQGRTSPAVLKDFWGVTANLDIFYVE